uniref:Uncharacterized protein n=1 Tax=Rhizophora mucronata TaxID=61149 RepID=A0A2P2N9A6_RHIMU
MQLQCHPTIIKFYNTLCCMQLCG